jgi:hypothetical protein
MDICPLWMGEVTPITVPQKSTPKPKSTDASFALSFHPLFLPFAIKWNNSKGFYAEHTGTEAIVTPVGNFGIEYSVAVGGTINGIEIKKSDFLVSIIDRNKGTQELFKIEGYNRLKVVLSGETTIDAQSGYVQIDATNSRIKEINFYDNSKASLVNSTDQTIPFYIQVGQNVNASTLSYKCEIPPNTYRLIPIDELNGWMTANVFIRINNDNSSNDSFKEVKKKVSNGDVCQIFKKNDKELDLRKINKLPNK